MKTFYLKSLLCVCFGALILNLSGQTPVYPQPENTLRLMSYNIRNARGLDEVTDYERIADIIRNVSPDVVALQEIDSLTERSGRVDVLAILGDLVKMYSVYGASIDYQGGKYGIGILSKEKPLSWKRVPLPGREEARSLLIVEFKNYIYCCTHFSLNVEDRLTSAMILNDEAKSFKKPAFVAGDFNDKPESTAIIELQGPWKMLNNPKQFTIPANKPKETIDYIFAYKPGNTSYSVLRRSVLNEPVASDHLPLFVDVRLSVGKSEIFRTNPYLQDPATDAMTVMWHTNVPCYSWLEYGTDTLNMRRARTYIEGEVIANTKLNKIRLTGLTPGTKYYYRIHSREITYYGPYLKEFGETASSGIASFRTLDDKTTDFTAVIFNDIHDKYPLFDKLYAHVKNIPYDIVFFNGDCIADVQTEDVALNSIHYYGSKIGADKVPSIYLRGNHETRGGYSMFLWNLLERMGGHSYGAFNIGDTRFVLLDCGEDKPDEHPVYYDLNDFTQHRKDQAEFLKKEIVSKEFKSAKKKVLIHHIPVYGMGEESYVPCRDLWENILSKADFSVCLNGHTHTYNYIPKGKEGNIFPVIIGGGSDEKSATVAILKKTGKVLNLKVLNVAGEILLDSDL
ncbi:MAG: endonuclease/exonuclease/phosphatase family protein [Dysgonamonadaceae bacterium]|jgi:endonuclease/exonuclease/phosphatase family metal-dependent hydrolase/predicted phosphodiesterase|nr:endonuclease/exonuclease/phosphatase family protein [Dysgonamonadaceae bacterium]